MRLEFKRLDPTVSIHEQAHPGHAGLDLRANADAEVGPGERAKIPTGLAVAIPAGCAGRVLRHSGLASFQGLTLAAPA
jgi:dUTP pyrophosphatase